MLINRLGPKTLRTTKSACACVLLLFGGCSWMSQWSQHQHISGYDRDIRNATQAIQIARDTGGRASAYSKRGSSYSEKARYSRAFKLIPSDEYERLFNLALKDHDQAITLNPNSAEVYFNRGQAYYDRATLELTSHQDPRPWFDRAAGDFEIATVKDPRNFMAYDLLGLSHEQNGEWDKAIHDYTRESAVNPLGRVRLADAYCGHGQQDQTDNRFEAAAADYEKSIEIGARPEDGCSCEPYNSLLSIYTSETHQYDKAWDLVHQAQRSNHQIASELVDQLKKSSGRTN